MSISNLEVYPKGTWEIDPSHSDVSFTVRHLMISKVRGSFGNISGRIVNSESEVTAEGLIDVTSINTNDENRDRHLRSADFFEVEKFPTMSFALTEVLPTKKSDEFKVVGNMTIKDVTRRVEFDVELSPAIKDGYGQTKIGITASTSINRGDFGLTWNTALETGGVLVSDEVKIQIEAQAVLNS